MIDEQNAHPAGRAEWPRLGRFPGPAKALVTMVIVAMSIGMFGALGQIVVHDIIPTFYAGETADPLPEGSDTGIDAADTGGVAAEGNERGDLFDDMALEMEMPSQPPPPRAIHETEQFVWLLKWTHIHLFGMSMIFIFLGAIAVFLDLGSGIRTGLVVLPFVGVVADIAAMWLKTYVSPLFFWMHIPGGGLFAAVFTFVAIRSLWEMWCRAGTGRDSVSDPGAEPSIGP